MTVKASRLGEYVVSGVAGRTAASRIQSYVVEGSPKKLLSTRLALYVVEGPPTVIPAAPRRRQLLLP